MSTLRTFMLAALTVVCAPQLSTANGNASITTGIEKAFSETPERTVIIKHPSATNLNTFFSTTTTLFFEVYKPGTKEDIATIIKTLTKNANVKSCTEGLLTGDYQGFTMELKSPMDKVAFGKLLKSAGLNTIKINANPIIESDKL